MTDAYVYDAVRTPRGRGNPKGALHEIPPIALATHVLKRLRDRNKLDTSKVDDIVMGVVEPAAEQGACVPRVAALTADYDLQAPGVQINRFCASGLEAVNMASAQVMSGQSDLTIGGGVESMSRVKMGTSGGAWYADLEVAFPTYFIPQGVSADLIATRQGYSRDDVDAYAVESQRRAALAQREGRFDSTIEPVVDILGNTLLDHDEHVRADSTMQSLAALEPAFATMGAKAGFDDVAILRYPDVERINHVHHAGNSSGIVDGAAAVLIGTQEAGQEIGLKPRARIKGFSSIGSEPAIMLTGPADSARKVLDRLGMSVADIDLFEVNEAFACELGIIDSVVPADKLLKAAQDWINTNGACEKPWYDTRYRPPGPTVQSPKGYEIFTAGNALLHAKTRGNYPAPHAIMACVYEGMQLPMDTALALESKYIAKLCASREARGMIRTLFFSMNEAKKLGRRPEGVDKASYARIGVLGAGMMGSAIAYVSALSGLDVVLLDTSTELAEQGRQHGAKVMNKLIDRQTMIEAERDVVLSRVTATSDFAQLDGCELVIEAVYEERTLKADVTHKAETVLSEKAIFASNTSTLPITGLEAHSERPHNFIGLHFFSPVDRMQLVEVITGEQTSEECLARCLDFVKRIGKVPIVVNDSLGFYTSRMVARFLDEGIAMVGEGINPALIENARKMAGFPVGPLALADEVSLELIQKIRKQHQRDLGDAFEHKPGQAVLTEFVEQLGRLGRKSGGGFYEYPTDAPKSLWHGLHDKFPRRNNQPDVEEIMKRLMYVQSVDAARCLEEGVLSDPRDGDVGSILGWGFPAYTGGAVSLIDYVGVDKFVHECDRLSRDHGERFEPPESLRTMAAEQRRFYQD